MYVYATQLYSAHSGTSVENSKNERLASDQDNSDLCTEVKLSGVCGR